MKRILFLIMWLPALLLGQSEPLLHPAQIGAYTAPLNSFMRSTGTFAEWVSQSTAQAALNYWTESAGGLYRNSKVAIRTTPSVATFHVSGESGNNQFIIDFAGTGANYYDSDSHNFRSGNGSVSLMALSIGRIANSGSGVNYPHFISQYTGGPSMKMQSFSAAGILGTENAYPVWFYSSGLSRMRIEADGRVAIGNLTTAGITKNDASGYISTTLPTVNLASSTVTMDYGSYIAKRKSTDEIRDEIGSLLWRKLTTGTQKRPGIVGNPTSWGQSEEWFDQSALRPAWSVGSTAGDVRHAASIEKEIIGDAPVANASSFTVGNNPYAFFQIADANSGTVNVTLDLTMLDGQEYTIACRRNATNAVIFNVPAGKQLDAQGGTALNDAPFTGAAHAIYTVSRIGEDNYIVK